MKNHFLFTWFVYSPPPVKRQTSMILANSKKIYIKRKLELAYATTMIIMIIISLCEVYFRFRWTEPALVRSLYSSLSLSLPVEYTVRDHYQISQRISSTPAIHYAQTEIEPVTCSTNWIFITIFVFSMLWRANSVGLCRRYCQLAIDDLYDDLRTVFQFDFTLIDCTTTHAHTHCYDAVADHMRSITHGEIVQPGCHHHLRKTKYMCGGRR